MELRWIQGYLFLKAMHLVGAVIWVGSMIFFSGVVMPAVRQALPGAQRPPLIRAMGRRYRILGWVALAILMISGLLLSTLHGVTWGSDFGRVFTLKIILVGLTLGLTGWHDFVLGPKAGGDSVDSKRRAITVSLARGNLILGLVIILLGICLTAA